MARRTFNSIESTADQAEALVHGHLPLTAVLGIGCFNDTVKQTVEAAMLAHGQKMSVKATPTWYF